MYITHTERIVVACNGPRQPTASQTHTDQSAATWNRWNQRFGRYTGHSRPEDSHPYVETWSHMTAHVHESPLPEPNRRAPEFCTATLSVLGLYCEYWYVFACIYLYWYVLFVLLCIEKTCDKMDTMLHPEPIQINPNQSKSNGYDANLTTTWACYVFQYKQSVLQYIPIFSWRIGTYWHGFQRSSLD